MRDPHVLSLTYKLKTTDLVSYVDPPAVRRERGPFSIELKDGILTVRMNDHFATVGEARGIVDPFIRSWEIHSALTKGSREFEFVFAHPEVIDRNPAQSTLPALKVVSTGRALASASVSVKVSRRAYPDPPNGFVATPDVEALWVRYQGWLEGREPILTMAYFALTVLEAAAGTRKKAASHFGIEFEMLRKLGELATERGDQGTARKMPRSGTLTPLTPEEERWIKLLIPELIRQAGEFSATGKVLRMSDLPSP